jgi:hypothetical protein
MKPLPHLGVRLALVSYPSKGFLHSILARFGTCMATESMVAHIQGFYKTFLRVDCAPEELEVRLYSSSEYKPYPIHHLISISTSTYLLVVRARCSTEA